jgi:hypothetical protein
MAGEFGSWMPGLDAGERLARPDACGRWSDRAHGWNGVLS